MRRSRLTFKYALQQCKKDEDAIRSDPLLDKDMVSFWNHINKFNNTRVAFATTIGGVTGENKNAKI